MAQLSGWKRKAVLLFKSERTLGAKDIASSYTDKSYQDMKQIMITAKDIDLNSIIDKPRIKDLTGHLNKVKNEFIGKSELCYYHATLIILLRRGFKPKEIFRNFESLWESESDYLLNNLSLRWLISACDTFVDHSENPLRSAILLNAVTLINTLKVYETEKFLRSFQDFKDINEENVARLYAEHLSLFDGLTYFRIGADDTLKNMRQRYQCFEEKDKLAYDILIFIFDKIQNLETAFSLMKKLHKDDKSQWWY